MVVAAEVAAGIAGVEAHDAPDRWRRDTGMSSTRAIRAIGLRTLAIEDLVAWTYADQLARRLGEAGAGLYPAERQADGVRWQETSRCGCAEIARIGRLGARIDRARELVRSSTEIHRDAETVHALLSGSPDRAAVAVVIECGEARRRPDWKPRGVRWGPLYWNPRKDTAMVEYSEDRAPYCPIILIDSEESVCFARAGYSAYLTRFAISRQPPQTNEEACIADLEECCNGRGSAAPIRSRSIRMTDASAISGVANARRPRQAAALSLNQRRILDVLREGGGYASYELLVEELWGFGPDEPGDARGALHSLLSRMRKVLGRDAIRTWHGQGVRLNPGGIEIDRPMCR